MISKVMIQNITVLKFSGQKFRVLNFLRALRPYGKGNLCAANKVKRWQRRTFFIRLCRLYTTNKY